ncbi:virulence plasmid B protein [Pseudomonas mandelii PD30]|uniref:Virulence plasmid B protein n=1 Tax=Pseudomonas mandelii PD30 TaxID=1419583 RepID=A0A059L264_9PSED|nr:SpvB/TcaC N-terminal domain-containing protein [Pseudomonas mandelii]KDD68326.1 virulence plasmid B protein [Pseudomonas mandelii PD30]
MEDQASLSITEPSIAKSASIATIGKSWGSVGVTGSASFELPLPLSAGRGFDPSMALSYDSQAGNGTFGFGWGLGISAITRRTRNGVPDYLATDIMIGPGGEELMPELDDEGKPTSRMETNYRGLPIGEHRVVRYWPRVESSFDLIELWRSDVTPQGFWLVHGADGSLHLYGKTEASRRAAPEAEDRVGAWLLQESMNTHGEHICFEYKPEETHDPDDAHDYSTQRYLQRVLYGNFEASSHLYGWNVLKLAPPSWHFHLLFDYGERTPDLEKKPLYGPPFDAPGEGFGEWQLRSDPFHSYTYGFELGTRRLCHQVLMFHHFPEQLGPKPALVRRLLLQYQTTSLSYTQLVAAHYQAYDASGAVENMPPVEFDYSRFELNKQSSPFFPFENMPGIEDGAHHQCVDLFGEGVPGFICRYDQSWYYREPLRALTGADDIHYGPWTELSRIPVADRNQPTYQALTDLTGDGRLDWILASPGMSGFHTLNPDRSWSGFIPFTAFPVEFFSTFSQSGDLMGDGLSSMALIGPRSVRLYANRREEGFAPGQEVEHKPDTDRLPLFSNSRTELVMLGNLLGSDMTELCRIRHDEIKCWPNLGHGRFGEGFVMSALPFDYTTFDAARVRIADLDGSGAPALIYLKSDCFEIYFNRGGNGLEQIPITIPWPDGIRYDNLCQVTLADLQGLGCASLILTVPHMKPRHWRYDFVSAKPYMLVASNNNMGCSTQVVYRSSAQEWLDEKNRILKFKRLPICYLPFPVPVVKQQRQLDEITGNRLNQFFQYSQGYYDGRNREFRGFGLLRQTDSETGTSEDDIGFTAPALVCTWFHTGRLIDLPRDGYFDRDPEALALKPTLFCQYHRNDHFDDPVPPADEATVHEITRALAGSVLRVETYAADDDLATAVPFAVEESRYKVRELRKKGGHDAYPIMLPLQLEKISYQYERFENDPLSRHEISLSHDECGLPNHSITVSYARRRTNTEIENPFEDPDERTWWSDAHDPAQQSYYLSESRATFIHLKESLQGWRLGLPYLQRGNALVLPKKPASGGLAPADISYEGLNKLYASPEWAAKRLLTTQSVNRYFKTDDRTVLADGKADFEALRAPLEIAQLDKTALQAYDTVPSLVIRDELAKIGYSAMPLVLGVDEEADKKEDQERNLWSSRYGFAKYGKLDSFYKVMEYNETPSYGITTACYDAYCLLPKSITQPDGCEARFEYDYHALQLKRSIDANDNVEEALYEPSGQPLAISFHGTEDGEEMGFRPLDEHERPADHRPDPAIENPKGALQKAASVLRKDLFSWMGELPHSVRQTPDWLATWIAQGDVLPSLHIRASARRRLARLTSLSEPEQTLLDLIHAAHREPVHSVVLTADRYWDDELQQIQIVKAFVDGFGRPLQIKQLVEPGLAFVVENGELVIEDGKPKVAHADPRWRVSERVEYNNKGLAVRVFRPYFANGHRYINDHSFRESGHHDQNFYDVLGRRKKVINAKGDVALEIIHPWYTTSLDFNDTYVAPSESELKAGKP